MTEIRPQKRLASSWRELWAYRELLYFLAWRDVKVRYKQTVLGASWAIFQPLVTMIVFTVIFNGIAGIQAPDGIPYAIFAYTGLLFWNLFSSALTFSSNSLLSSQAMITKVYFPRLITPFSATFVAAIDFFFAFLVYLALLIYYGFQPGLEGVLLFLPMLLITFVAAAGAGTFLAAVNVKYRDVRFALPFLTGILLYLTPVIYPVSLIPQKYQWLLYLNPLTGVIQAVRSGTLHSGGVPWGYLGLSALTAIAFLGLGVRYFSRNERRFADIL